MKDIRKLCQRSDVQLILLDDPEEYLLKKEASEEAEEQPDPILRPEYRRQLTGFTD